MSTATLSSKGQITIPAGVRHAMGLDTGDRIEFIEVGPGRYELVAATLPVTALKGLAAPPAGTPVVGLDAMDRAVRQRAARTLDPPTA